MPHDSAPDPLADRLRTWQPSEIGLDRDRLIYEAGRAAGIAQAASAARRHAWTSMLAASFVLGGSILLASRLPRPAEQARPVPVSPAPSISSSLLARADDPPGPDSYLVLTRTLMTAGSAVWPDRPSRPAITPPAPRQPSLSPRDALDFDRLPNL